MATQKKAWLSALATFVLIAVIGVTFAFKPFNSITKPTSAGEKWYEFTNALADGDISNPLNYSQTPSGGANPPSCPTGTAERCAVKAQPSSNPIHPNLSAGSVTEIKTRASE